MTIHIVAALVVGLAVALLAHVKGRTGWHWLLLSVCAFGIIWLATVVALDLAGIQVWLASPKLAMVVGALTGLPILIIVISVPTRPRRHAGAAPARPQTTPGA